MLCRDHNRIHRNRGVIAVIPQRYLGFAVGPQIHQGAVLTHLCQLLREPMRQPHRGGHEHVRLVRCIPKHDALISRALPVIVINGYTGTGLKRLIHARINIGRLLADRHRDAAELTIKTTG